MARVMPDSSPARWKTPASNWKISPCSSRHFQAKSGTAYQLCLVLSGGAGLPPGGTTYQHHLGVPWPGHLGPCRRSVSLLGYPAWRNTLKEWDQSQRQLSLCSLSLAGTVSVAPAFAIARLTGPAPLRFAGKNSGCRPHFSRLHYGPLRGRGAAPPP